MDIGVIFTISCVLTTVTMTLIVGIILFFVRYGGQGVKMLIDRFLGGGDNKDKEPDLTTGRGQTERQPAVASSQSFRTKAQQLDFPAPGQAGSASSEFSAQASNSPGFPAPQQASLTPRGQFPDFNQQGNQLGQTQGFQLSTPSLSPSRPFQAGSQFSPNPAQQQQRFGQQPLQGNQFGQQSPQQASPGQQQPLQGNQYGQQRPGQQPLQGNQYGQQRPGQQPLQGGNQYGQQQQGFNAQGLNPPANPNPQQGGLGQNLPPLRSLPRPGNTQYDAPIGRRDSRRGDQHDLIYDDQRGNLLDDVGDFIDNF